MKIFKLFGHLALIILLTLTTQVGGLIWLLSCLICYFKNYKKRFIFPLLYVLCNLIIVPFLAPKFGRVALPYNSNTIKAARWFYPLSFRNYVRPELKTLLINASKKSRIKIAYLDANFPFFNGFPLLPHLSHNDGKKIDLCFVYKDKNGKATTKIPSTSGYGVFVNEKNKTSNYCVNKGYWQYNFTKYLSFGNDRDLKFNALQTKQLIRALLQQSKAKKLFIEPYLKTNLGLQNENKIRFHGCKAVRHDDHIHLEIK